MTDTTTATEDLHDALDELRAAVETSAALAPLRRLLVDVDERLRAAARQCRTAGLSERGIAARAEVAPASLRDWLDGRQSDPLPAPSLHEQLWIYHQVATALGTLVARTEAEDLPNGAPTDRHAEPAPAVNRARRDLGTAAGHLSAAATAMEYRARR